MPLVGITFLKIQNYLIHKYGFSIEESVIKYINTELKDFAKTLGQTSINIIGSWGWCEIILVFHSNSYEKIKKCILKLRELPKCELNIFQKEDKDKGGHVFNTTFTNAGFSFNLVDLLEDRCIEDKIRTIYSILRGYFNYGMNLDIHFLKMKESLQG